MVSGSFHSPSGVLFTFPSRYLCTIGHDGVFSLRRWSSRIRAEFHVLGATWGQSPGSQSPFAYGTFTLYGPPSQVVRLENWFLTSPSSWQLEAALPHNPAAPMPASFCRAVGLGSSPFARRYLGNRIFFLFLWVLRWFSSPGSPIGSVENFFRCRINPGFPHSDIHGSKVACTSPWLIAARYVLHRLVVPRHPPYALSSLLSRPPQPYLPLKFSKNICGEYRVRTGDLRLAKPALSHLS